MLWNTDISKFIFRVLERDTLALNLLSTLCWKTCIKRTKAWSITKGLGCCHNSCSLCVKLLYLHSLIYLFQNVSKSSSIIIHLVICWKELVVLCNIMKLVNDGKIAALYSRHLCMFIKVSLKYLKKKCVYFYC